jgi:glucuronate isomerase
MASALRLHPDRFFLPYNRTTTIARRLFAHVETRAYFSILARRIDCAYLAELVATHRLDEAEAAEIAVALAYKLPKAAYKL